MVLKIKKFLLSSVIFLVSLSSFTYLVKQKGYITRNIKELISGKTRSETIRNNLSNNLVSVKNIIIDWIYNINDIRKVFT